MRKAYEFAKLKGRRNPQASKLRKKAVTRRGEQYTDKRMAELLKEDRIDAKTASKARRLLGG